MIDNYITQMEEVNRVMIIIQISAYYSVLDYNNIMMYWSFSLPCVEAFEVNSSCGNNLLPQLQVFSQSLDDWESENTKQIYITQTDIV